MKIEIAERMLLKILININAREPETISIRSLGLRRFNNIDGLTMANNHQDKDREELIKAFNDLRAKYDLPPLDHSLTRKVIKEGS